jgi:hypothetical protein
MLRVLDQPKTIKKPIDHKVIHEGRSPLGKSNAGAHTDAAA